MKKIFLTGATGFLGRHISLQLLNEGNKLIFLSRSKDGLSAKERVKHALNFVNPDTYRKYKKNFTIVEGDVTESIMGLTDEYFLKIVPDTDEVWHTAGSISFSEKEREKIININARSMEKILKFIEAIKPRKFHYISTAYVNDKNKIHEDELDCYREFNNPYEESKCKAEKLVRDWADRNKETNVFIYRPSIIVGDSRTGKISNFSGYYMHARMYYLIKKSLINKGESNNNTVHVPIRVPGLPSAMINIITVDYAVDMIMKLRDKDKSGIYHIIHQNPPTYSYLIEHSLKALGISGPSVNGKKATTKRLKKIEARINNGLRDYLPYISKELVFDQTNIRKALGKDFRRHQTITPELINKLIRYAISCDFKDIPKVSKK